MENKFLLLYHRQIARSQKGFSLAEIVMTLGIMTFVVLGNTLFIHDFIKRLSQYEKESAVESEMAVLSIMAMNILKKSSLSFNRIYLADDKGRNFFDYYPDMPMSTFSSDGDRSILLTAGDNVKAFYLLSTEEGDFRSMSYNPMHAYDELTTPTDIRLDGTIRYRGLNTVPAITDNAGVPAKYRLMTTYFEERWANGKLFVLTCPTYLRPLDPVSNTINLKAAPRTATFIGKVMNDDLVPLYDGEATVKILNYHPVTQAAYNSLDQYLRTLPVVGGASSFVKIEPAQLARFEMRPNKNYPSGFADLYLRKWNSGGFSQEYSVAEKIKSVAFKRKSITLPLISMEIQK